MFNMTDMYGNNKTLICAIRLPLQIGCFVAHGNYLRSKPDHKKLKTFYIQLYSTHNIM